VRDRLLSLIEDSRKHRDLFTAASTLINLVLNTDPLACSEAERIYGKLKDIDMSVTHLILNKYHPEDAQDAINQSLGGYPVWRFPLSSIGLTGLTALEGYLLNHPHLMT
jgi:anion-transporting  ArsA/GET3 family ATPase